MIKMIEDQHPAFGYNKPGLLKIDSYLIDNMKQKNVKTSFNNNSREGTHEYPSLPSGDLRLSSKSEIESFDDENEIYGIIPYVAPEDKNHDEELIIDLCPPIVTNECWHSDPNKRPTTTD
ncbi:hypothetical protein RhiirC2_777220 [Rhizophagus irregularis]|uniref:Uncharacterized protein n=1 Tax=Rhizophagus irregularis TaxID=588596 RepID=A0A2N1NEZ6_9GLOM|nr:hypothetical protein RhiirC2_777220 [Rhizophagus irregularis]